MTINFQLKIIPWFNEKCPAGSRNICGYSVDRWWIIMFLIQQIVHWRFNIHLFKEILSSGVKFSRAYPGESSRESSCSLILEPLINAFKLALTYSVTLALIPILPLCLGTSGSGSPCEAKQLRYLSKEECRNLINACRSHLKPIVITALNTGMRREEILSLEWRNILISIMDLYYWIKRKIMKDEKSR